MVKTFSETHGKNEEVLTSFTATIGDLDCDNTKPSGCKKTKWKLVIATALVVLLAALEGGASGMSEWPYMHTIDEDATSQFFGTISSVSKVGHAVFAVFFNCIYYRFQNIKIPLIFGRLLSFIGALLYLCVEFLPTNRRYLIMFCQLLFGISSSSNSVFRMYVVQISSEEDRSRAYSAIVLASVLSIVISPVIQICFSGIKYPGYEIFPNVRFHIFSATIWVAVFINIVSVIVICTVLEAIPRRSGSKKTGQWGNTVGKIITNRLQMQDIDGISVTSRKGCYALSSKSTNFNIAMLKKRFNAFINLDVIWKLVIICWLEKMASQFAILTLQTVMSPFFMIAFGWNSEQTVTISAVMMGIIGVLSLCFTGTLMTPCIGKRLSPRFMFFSALCIFSFMFLSLYPYPGISHPMPAYNATTKIGCNPKEYRWCSTEKATTPVIFLPIIILVMTVGMPLGAVSLDTIYSKILGNIDQSLMQGVMVVAEDIIHILGPLFVSRMFTAYGQATVWIVNGTLTFLASLLWASVLPKLKQFK